MNYLFSSGSLSRCGRADAPSANMMMNLALSPDIKAAISKQMPKRLHFWKQHHRSATTRVGVFYIPSFLRPPPTGKSDQPADYWWMAIVLT